MFIILTVLNDIFKDREDGLSSCRISRGRCNGWCRWSPTTSLAAVIPSSDLVLRPLFPPIIPRRPGLRRRQHEFTLPEKDYRKFIPRILFRALKRKHQSKWRWNIIYFDVPSSSSSFTNSTIFALHHLSFIGMFSDVAKLPSVDRCRLFMY